ncbi:MAG: FAD-binding oxidoreductase [Candidatus Aureabacteria bacterium]|nr:FAD-binding oxidoreductase [Candidatus Auribacterota bacterium]
MKNRIHAEKARELPGLTRRVEVEGAEAIAANYSDYLKDESRLSGGKIGFIAFPKSESDIAAFLKKMNERGIPITVSAGRTGIVGGAVPMKGALLSLEKMDRILGVRKGERAGEWFIRTQPGLLVKDLHKKVEKKDLKSVISSLAAAERKAVEEFMSEKRHYFYPVDPTELSASIGGTLATNASGERSYHYGPTRNYVRGLSVVLANGDVLNIRRGEVIASKERTFEIVLTDGSALTVPLPTYRMPEVKSAAGYYIRDGMDLIDLFIGAEGTLGVISEVEVAVLETPPHIMSLVAFFPSNEDAVSFFKNAREALPSALVFEYFDSSALDILREKKALARGAFAIPALPKNAKAAIFLELVYTEEDMDGIYAAMDRVLAAHHSSTENTWSGTRVSEREKIRALRHAVPEAVNEIVARNKRAFPSVYKLGTDMAVPGEKFEEMLSFYKELLRDAKIQYAIFGHIGEHHLHVNILPRTEQEIERAKKIIREYAKKAVACGGTVSAEHGIGKIKHPYLEILYGKEGMRQMAAVKRILDPKGILSRGNIFPEELLV